MRHINLEHTDYDTTNGETWTEITPGYLLTPYIAMKNDEYGIGFYCFEKAVADDQPSVSTRNAHVIDLPIGGASAKDIDLAELANMTIAELAKALVKQK